MMKDKEDEKEETVVQSDDKRSKPIIDEVEMQKPHINKERNIDLQFDLEKPDRDSIHKSQHHHIPKSQSQSFKVTISEEPTHTDKTGNFSLNLIYFVKKLFVLLKLGMDFGIFCL